MEDLHERMHVTFCLSRNLARLTRVLHLPPLQTASSLLYETMHSFFITMHFGSADTGSCLKLGEERLHLNVDIQSFEKGRNPPNTTDGVQKHQCAARVHAQQIV